MKSMYHSLHNGNLFVLVHDKEPPTDTDWNLYLDDMRGLADSVQNLRTLVFTSGGSPSTFQRERLNKILAGRPTRVVVVTDQLLPRCVVTALSWFNPQIKAFAPHDVGRAYLHLGIGEQDAAAIGALVSQWQKDLRARSAA